MGGEPWLLRRKHEVDVESALLKCRDEILEMSPDWPDVRIEDKKVIPGLPVPYCSLMPFSRSDLMEIFGTDKPQASMDTNDIYDKDFWGDIPRGQGHYFVLYTGDAPAELCFLGYSFD